VKSGRNGGKKPLSVLHMDETNKKCETCLKYGVSGIAVYIDDVLHVDFHGYTVCGIFVREEP